MPCGRRQVSSCHGVVHGRPPPVHAVGCEDASGWQGIISFLKTRTLRSRSVVVLAVRTATSPPLELGARDLGAQAPPPTYRARDGQTPAQRLGRSARPQSPEPPRASAPSSVTWSRAALGFVVQLVSSLLEFGSSSRKDADALAFRAPERPCRRQVARTVVLRVSRSPGCGSRHFGSSGSARARRACPAAVRSLPARSL